jgi:hypothetical protein
MNMPVSVTVSNVVGSPPYEIYLCISGSNVCYYIDFIQTAQIPYNFVVPTPLQSFQSFCLRVVDNDGCEINNCFYVT